MEWYKSFIVKDALHMLSRIRRGKDTYENSFHPDMLGEMTKVMLDCPERPSDFQFNVQAPPREYDNICLTSGGADSTIAWYWAEKPVGLYIDIGQPYTYKERAALKLMEIPHVYVDMRGSHAADVRWKHIIPGRNFLFLCVAAEMVKDYGNIWFSVVDGEGADSGKGDKSLLFISLFQDWYFACTGRRIFIQTMIDKTKSGWLQWFAEKKYDVNIIRKMTVTCFSEEHGQCGTCQACLRKYLSFVSIGMEIAEDFVAHPMFGAAEYVEKYKKVLNEALTKQDFSHYSRLRCIEDLAAIEKATSLMLSGESS